MARPMEEALGEVDFEVAPASPQADTAETPRERFPKLKGKSRILKGLQRIGSSNSITRLRSSSSGTYRGAGRGSVSCISLSSSTVSPYGDPWAVPLGSTISNGYSTAPTSVPGTPGIESSRIKFANGSRSALPADLKTRSRSGTGVSTAPTIEEDYFSLPVVDAKPRPIREDFDFWGEMPMELRMQILSKLKPRQIIQCARVSKAWYKMCFDGQLWAYLDAAEFYRDIPPEALTKIITSAGPFARDLNLRGCMQLWDQWRASGLLDACKNLEHLSLEGCSIDRNSIHSLLYMNPRLVHINMCGLPGVTNSSLKIIAQYCSKIEYLNISWCKNVDSRGLRRIAEACHNLKDFRLGEVRGVNDADMMHSLFKHNKLERLIMCNCDTLTDEALTMLFHGNDSEIDFLTGRHIVPARRLRHLDLSRCRNITDTGLKALAHNVPHLEGLQLAKCPGVSDSSLLEIFPTVPSLTHLDIEELEQVTNASLQELARSPCASSLRHISISYCESLGDMGMLPVIKACPNLTSLDMDNTRISDLVLSEAAAMVSRRNAAPPAAMMQRRNGNVSFMMPLRPKIGLRMEVYDCQNVTWNGIRDVLAHNAEVRRPMHHSCPSVASPAAQCDSTSRPAPESQVATPIIPLNSSRANSSSALATSNTPSSSHAPRPKKVALPSMHAHGQPFYPHQIISLKVFYGYQPTVTEHTRRTLRGDFHSAARLERKWAEYMHATDESNQRGGALGNLGAGLGIVGMGIAGYQARRRRRRLREAQMMHADEEEGLSDAGVGTVGGVGRRRRARSGGGCAVM